MKFRKYEFGYLAIVNDAVVATIHTYYNWYDHSNYYEVDGKNFKYLKDAKEYCKANH